MSFAGSSRPASGSEHHLSHFFEIVGIIKNEEYFPHGIDVAYSTVVTAELRQKLLNREFPNSIYRESREMLHEKLQGIYGSVAENCIALQDKVGDYRADRLAIYKAKEKEIRAVLQEMPSADAIKEMLSRVELDVAEFYALYGEEKINQAIIYAKDLKDRYTVLWPNYDFGGTKE
jgi:glycerol-1-phosphate dehydrogenase [NAD(P)+]